MDALEEVVAVVAAGRERPTIYHVADLAQVSIATVSRVLKSPDKVSEATRARVLTAIDTLGYVPHGAARSLAVKAQEAHGLVLPELRGPYYADLLSGYESAAAEGGDSVVLLLTDGKRDADLAVRRLAGRVDGMVIFGEAPVAHTTVAAVQRKIPVLGVAGPVDGPLETLGTENVLSAEALTGHLLDVHGCRDLLFVGSPQRSADVAERYAGFVAAHRARGLHAREPVESAFREEDGAAVVTEVLRLDRRPDGLVCTNDELALAVMEGLARRGVSVPDDIRVTGWDDVMAARYVTPALTTVRQPVRELGRRVALRMRALLSGMAAEAAEVELLPTELVVRRSCGCR